MKFMSQLIFIFLISFTASSLFAETITIKLTAAEIKAIEKEIEYERNIQKSFRVIAFRDEDGVIFDSRIDLIKEPQQTEMQVGSTQVSIHGSTATYNSLADLGRGEFDNADTVLILLDLGVSVGNDIFGLPIDAILKMGVAAHFEDNLQEDLWGVIAGLSLSWTSFPWNEYIKTRIEVTEGISINSDVPWIEQHHTDVGAASNTSNVLNYLEFFLGLRIGFLTGDDFETYIGPVINHRSGIFGLINEVHGGSNFLGFKMQVFKF